MGSASAGHGGHLARGVRRRLRGARHPLLAVSGGERTLGATDARLGVVVAAVVLGAELGEGVRDGHLEANLVRHRSFDLAVLLDDALGDVEPLRAHRRVEQLLGETDLILALRHLLVTTDLLEQRAAVGVGALGTRGALLGMAVLASRAGVAAGLGEAGGVVARLGLLVLVGHDTPLGRNGISPSCDIASIIA